MAASYLYTGVHLFLYQLSMSSYQPGNLFVIGSFSGRFNATYCANPGPWVACTGREYLLATITTTSRPDQKFEALLLSTNPLESILPLAEATVGNGCIYSI